MAITVRDQLLTALIVSLAFGSGMAQVPTPAADDRLVDLLVWGADTTPAITGLSAELQTEVDSYRRRWEAYQPILPKLQDPLMVMIYHARVRYERRLVAIGRDPQAIVL